MKIIIFLILVVFTISLAAEKAFAQSRLNLYENPQQYNTKIPSSKENVLIILDCSFSMDDTIHDKRKIDIAKNVINTVLSQIPADVHIGLRAYGHKKNLVKSLIGIDECEVSELLVPIGTNNRREISLALSKLNAVGWTPICYSIDQAVKYDFPALPGKKRIILVSDGMETCNGSPCDFAVDLVKRNVDVSIDVIGFDLSSDPSAVNSLKCAALVTRGKYYTADNPQQFLKSLQDSFSVSTEVQGQILKN